MLIDKVKEDFIRKSIEKKHLFYKELESRGRNTFSSNLHVGFIKTTCKSSLSDIKEKVISYLSQMIQKYPGEHFTLFGYGRSITQIIPITSLLPDLINKINSLLLINRDLATIYTNTEIVVDKIKGELEDVEYENSFFYNFD